MMLDDPQELRIIVGDDDQGAQALVHGFATPIAEGGFCKSFGAPSVGRIRAVLFRPERHRLAPTMIHSIGSCALNTTEAPRELHL